MRLRTQILLLLLLFALAPLTTAVVLNLPLVLERMALFYHKAHLQNLRADFRDLDQHLASREEMVRLLAKLPEPGTVMGTEGSPDKRTIERARLSYTEWINQILRDQLDIFQILFLDRDGAVRFWLERGIDDRQWRASGTVPELPAPSFTERALQGQPGNVLVSPISINPEAASSDPRRLMTLRLASLLAHPEDPAPLGAVVISVDVGGIARFYSDTLWVQNDGNFLQQAGQDAPSGSAFTRFPGLQPIFAEGKPALWQAPGRQIMWVPLFRTEESESLWVGRWVDPSPIAEFRNALTLRVLSIVLILALASWFLARWIARRVEGVGRELLDGITRVLEDDASTVTFNWRNPQEMRRLGEGLTRLAAEHGSNIRDLQAHARKLEESNLYKSQFLANVSHELRTPLNSILLLSKMLGATGSGLTPEQAQQARVIHEAGNDLRTLIDNILDLSRIEAQRTIFSLDRVNLPELLEGLRELVQPQFAAKGLTLELESDHDAPRVIYSDAEKIRQILKNFLANAVKFTEQGGATLRLAASSGEHACDCPVAIEVRDSGIGIPVEQQLHIFDAFKQADGSTSRRFGGTGLGLTISQQLAHLLGGHIELRSEVAAGATFTLLLPLQFDASAVPDEQLEVPGQQAGEPSAARRRAPVAEGDAEISGHRLLLVDDDLRNLLALTPLLEGWGLEVTAAGDGVEALEVLAEEPPFSLVLMDVMMPELDGYDTIRRIRAQASFQDLVIIALTAKAGDSDREACLEVGADDFIAKPVDSDELKRIIARHLPPHTP